MLPKFEPELIRPVVDSELGNELFYPDWKCFCCEDSGMIRSISAKQVIPNYSDWHHKPITCQRCDKGSPNMNDPNYDQRFNYRICVELDKLRRDDWKATVKSQQRNIDITKLAKSLSMPGCRDRTGEDEREIQIEKAEIEAIAPEEWVEMADRYLGAEK